MMFDLSTRVAIVSGASAGIGASVVRDLVAAGASVVVNARRAEKLEQLCDGLDAPGRIAMVPGDVAEHQTIGKLFSEAKRCFHRPADLVVVNAGRGLPGSMLKCDDSQWDELIRTNILGAFRLMREAAQEMLAMADDVAAARDIVVLGSCVGRNVAPMGAVYSATKFAVHAATEALRREVCMKGIRVSLIEPGIVQTEFHTAVNYGENFYERVAKEKGPLIGTDDISRAICFVVSQQPHVHVYDIAIRPVRQEYP